MTLQELDFLSEEANLRKFRALPHDSLIYVPTMYEQLSTSRVLVTEWIDGLRLTDYLNRNPQRAEGLLRQLLSCYVQQITQFGVYHADPHPGNFLVMADGRVAVLDYGAIGELTPEEQVTTLAGHDGEVFICAWSPNSELLASGSGDSTSRIWPVPSASACGVSRRAHH